MERDLVLFGERVFFALSLRGHRGLLFVDGQGQKQIFLLVVTPL
jgi:hypothetical protein